MDILTFVASVLGAIAWPLLIGCLALAFRKELVGLIRRAKSIEVGGTKSEFLDYTSALGYLEERTEVLAKEPDSVRREEILRETKEVVRQLKGVHPKSLAFIIEIGRGVSRDDAWEGSRDELFRLKDLGLIELKPIVRSAAEITRKTEARLTDDGHRFLDGIGYTDHHRGGAS